MTTLLVACCSGAVGCGKEVGRVPFFSEGTGATTVELAAGKVAFWTDLDLKCDTRSRLAYEVALLQGGVAVANAVCDPLGNLSIKFGFLETWSGTSMSRSGRGKLSCEATLPAAGLTTVKSRLVSRGRPALCTIGKADLVIKQ